MGWSGVGSVDGVVKGIVAPMLLGTVKGEGGTPV